VSMLLPNRVSGHVSPLQGDAWAAWNASYHEPNGEVYRTLGTALYVQDWRERVTAQFALLDEQNAQLDALLVAAEAAAESEIGPQVHETG
jgi:hypothetical protein